MTSLRQMFIVAGLAAVSTASYGGFIVHYFEDTSVVQITGNCSSEQRVSSLSYECAGYVPLPKADPSRGILSHVEFDVLGSMQQSFELDTSSGEPAALDLDISLTSLVQYQFPNSTGVLSGAQTNGILSWPSSPETLRKALIAKSIRLDHGLDELYGTGSYLMYLNLASLGLAEPEHPVFSDYFEANVFAEIRYVYVKGPAGAPTPEPSAGWLVGGGIVVGLVMEYRRRLGSG